MYNGYYGGYTPQVNPIANLNNAIGQCYQQIQSIPGSMQTQPASGKLFVLNENEAASYLVAPNNMAILWDKNMPVIYVKSVDANNIPSMEILDYTVRSPNVAQPAQHECTCSKNFVTIDKFNELKEQFDSLAAMYQSRSEKEVNENE